MREGPLRDAGNGRGRGREGVGAAPGDLRLLQQQVRLVAPHQPSGERGRCCDDREAAVKIPSIPLPEPLLYEITVSHKSARSRRSMVHALRFLLWAAPTLLVDYVLATADGGRHSLWLTLTASFAVLAVAVLLVGVRDGSGEGQQ
jgi:hypothetical protein